MAPEVKPHPFRVFVSGLSKTHVERYDGGIVEEDNLGYFFYDRGCKVEDVRLMVDPSTSKCRGFGFVDFVDQDSFHKALGLAGTQDPPQVKLDHSSGGRIKVEAAKPAQPVVRDKHQELAKARDHTEDMERALRWREAKARELSMELHKHRERQKLLDARRTVEQCLEEEKLRQDEIRQAEEKLAAVEEVLRAALTSEQDRTRALEAIAHSVDENQRRSEAHPEEAGHEEAARGPGPELRIKNTFYEFCIPKDVEPLVRTKTAPSAVNKMGGADAQSPTDGNNKQEGTSTSSSAKASPLLTLMPAPSPPAPWALKRDTSHILRSILEDKMEAESEKDASEAKGRSSSRHNNKARAEGPRAVEQVPTTPDRKAERKEQPGLFGVPGDLSIPADHITSWADESESLEPGDVEPWSAPSSPSGRREVRIRNLPLQPAEELKESIKDELARLWRVVLNRTPPVVEFVTIADHQDESGAVAQQVQVAATLGAFALWCCGGNQVVTWGNADEGGDCAAVQDQLRNVLEIQGTHWAFAAILADGSVVTWGDPKYGGDCSSVQSQLRNVQQIQATDCAFAAILADGSVVTWGRLDNGGNSSAVQGQLRNVKQIQAAECAFAAILADASVVSWGDPDWGADCSAVQDKLRNVQQIQATTCAFAAILADGSVVAWGDPERGGDCSAVQGQLRNVQQIQATTCAFAAILADGSVVAWGDPECGGDCSAVQLQNVQQIQATDAAFAAILGDGSVVTWGDPKCGGDCAAVQGQLRNVQQIQASSSAFAAILCGGSVVTWGDAAWGGDCSIVEDQLRNVQQIQAAGSAFAAILADGSVVSWGDPKCGGDCSAVQNQLRNVRHIQATRCGAFAAILADGSLVTWGAQAHGGDCRAVQDQLLYL